MHTRCLKLASILPTLVAALLPFGAAHADIYTWVDASGRVNSSNAAPPDGAHVTHLVHTTAPKSSARAEAVRAAEARALADRVRELEDQVRRREASPVAANLAPPVSTVAPYAVAAAPPQVQVTADPAPSSYSGCDVSWAGCATLWGPGFYPPSVVVLNSARTHRSRPANIRNQMAGARHNPAGPTPRPIGAVVPPRRH
jgi:hypothetical protein